MAMNRFGQVQDRTAQFAEQVQQRHKIWKAANAAIQQHDNAGQQQRQKLLSAIDKGLAMCK